MVVKGLKRLTNFGKPNEKLYTQWGILTRERWLEIEKRNHDHGVVLKDSRGNIAIFAKGEEYADNDWSES